MNTSVNLLPFEYRRKGLLRRRLTQWSFVWIMCATMAFGAWWLKYDRYHARLRESSTAERAYLPLAKLMRESEEMQAELKELQAQDTVFGQLLDEKPLVTLVGMTSRSARRCNGRLALSQLFFERQEVRSQSDGQEVKAKDQNKKHSQQAAKGSQPWALVRFKGEALDNLAVATFAAALRDTRLFRRVELRSSVGDKSGDTGIRSFLLECEI